MLRRIVKPLLRVRLAKSACNFPKQNFWFMNPNHISLSKKIVHQFSSDDYDSHILELIEDLQMDIENADYNSKVDELINFINYLDEHESKDPEIQFQVKLTFYNSIIALGELYQQFYTFEKLTKLIKHEVLEGFLHKDKLKSLQTLKLENDQDIATINIVMNRWKQFEIVNIMIKNSKTMDVETLHECINDVLDQIELIGHHMINKKEDIKFQQLMFCKFYLFVSEIFLERGDLEEYERFQDYGFEHLFKVLKKQDTILNIHLKNTLFGSLIFLSQRVVQNEVISTQQVEKLFNHLFDSYDLLEDQDYLLSIKPQQCFLLCNYYQMHQMNDKVQSMLEVIRSIETFTLDPDIKFQYMIIQYFLFEGQLSHEKELASISKELDDQNLEEIENADTFLSGLKYHRHMFLKEIQEKELPKIELRLNKIFFFAERLQFNITIELEQDPFFLLLMFNIVDEIVSNKQLPKREEYLKKLFLIFSDFEFQALKDAEQEFQKQFYIVSLSFIVSEWIPVSLEKGFFSLNKFIDSYKGDDRFSEQFFMKLLDLNYYILGENHIIKLLKDSDPEKKKLNTVRDNIKQIIELLKITKANIDKDQLIQLFQTQLIMVDDLSP